MRRFLMSFLFVFFLTGTLVHAETKEVLDLQIKQTVERFEKEAQGAKALLEKASGYLVIPNLYKAGLVIGGGYGEGGLVVGGKVVEYYNMITASIGFQAGVQKRSVILVFLTPDALENFRKKTKWKVGVDGSIAFVNWGGGIDLSTTNFKSSIVAFAFDNKGIMYNLSLDGSIFNKINK
ncbi:lipid-binding SYLF domain-containing protein [Nitratifractor sp.]